MPPPICYTPNIMKKEETLKTIAEPCMFGGFVAVRESPLDRLPWYWKLALVVGVFFCCVKFTVPVLEWIAAHCF